MTPFHHRPHGALLGLTVLGSGSDGNAMVLHGEAGGLLLDAGFSAAELKRRLAAAGIPESWLRAALITHEHGDHVKGLRVAAAAFGIPVYCNRMTAEAIRQSGAAPEATLNLFTSGAPFELHGFRIEPFSISHDAADPAAFTIHQGGRKIAIVTDLGHAGSLVQHHLRDSDLLVIESNHDVAMLMASGRPLHVKRRILGKHGHLSNEACMALLTDVLQPRTRHVVFVHASRECNRYELVEQCARKCLTRLGRPDLLPLVARQDAGLPTLWA